MSFDSSSFPDEKRKNENWGNVCNTVLLVKQQTATKVCWSAGEEGDLTRKKERKGKIKQMEKPKKNLALLLFFESCIFAGPVQAEIRFCCGTKLLLLP